ncbi:MAG: hypothetical protein BWY64_02951 [bacterium ADurb.Bin363]|nr:MAG: hypothetical protein BWY64_02951 [bacterium ADurb.Bin363]
MTKFIILFNIFIKLFNLAKVSMRTDETVETQTADKIVKEIEEKKENFEDLLQDLNRET